MNVFFDLIRSQQIPLYAAFGVLLLVSLRFVLARALEYRRSLYSLEKEIAVKKLTRMSILLAVTLLLLAGTYLTGKLTSTVVDIVPTPTPVPTLTFLAAPVEDASGDGVVVADDILTAGCDPAFAAVVSPEDGAEISGIEEILGTANIQNFAFYKYEYRPAAPGSVWRSIYASTEPVEDGRLGAWDTGLVAPGEYLFRLVVADTSGNAPYPCVLRVRIIGVEE